MLMRLFTQKKEEIELPQASAHGLKKQELQWALAQNKQFTN